MAVAIAYGSLDCLGVEAGKTVLMNGAGTTVGFAAVQISLLRGARVIATAGPTFADQLAALGAVVTAYGDGLPERVSALLDKLPDLVLDVAPVSGALPALVQIASDPKRVMTISDFAAAKTLGVRSNLEEPGMRIRYDVLKEFADLAAEGSFSVRLPARSPLTSGRRHSPSAKASRRDGNSSFYPDPVSPGRSWVTRSRLLGNYSLSKSSKAR